MNIDKDLLYRFFYRITTFEEEVKIRKWIEASEENYKEFFKERAFFDAMLFQGNIERKVSKGSNILLWKKSLVIISGIAAIILLTIALTAEHFKQSYQDGAMNTIVVPAGQRVSLILSDGTSVWLNAKTRIEYPQNFLASDRRTVKIDGEAYFEVTKNPKKPFIVETSKGTVEVLGTKFFVNAYASSDKFETALMEGKVNVQASNRSMILLPNDKAVLVKGQLVRKKVEDMDLYRWRDGLYCFKDLNFDEVLKQFEVYYDIRFIRENAHLDNPKITGKFRLVDGIDYALRVLQREVKFTYHRDEETNVIYLK